MTDLALFDRLTATGAITLPRRAPRRIAQEAHLIKVVAGCVLAAWVLSDLLIDAFKWWTGI